MPDFDIDWPDATRVALVAPSGALSPTRLDRCIQALEERHRAFWLGKHVRRRHRAMAGTVAERLSDLHYAYKTPEIDALWALRGGYGCAQLLESFDWQELSHAKPLIGYSDLTAWLEYARRQGLPGIHGPVLTEWAIEGETSAEQIERQRSLSSVTALLAGTWPEFDVTPVSIDTPIEGAVIGGNLTVLASLCGTPYALSPPPGAILILEDVGEPLYRLERSLCQLLESLPKGSASAVGLGEFVGCGETDAIIAMAREHLDAHAMALATNLPIGHGPRNLAWPYGERAILDKTSLRFLKAR
ncbi:S66 peptidase family protein [Larsenimonas salina]|uniref:S66 peptidase family protein n=1 Tax=Larsenimonas salina TaxID=1295565 RepID=UPI002073CB1F|nr:LD-carboxypeptidase [Larsenimonas salina]MCM5703296.1 LD-carboxypeptidase [Larsenimonas salina]